MIDFIGFSRTITGLEMMVSLGSSYLHEVFLLLKNELEQIDKQKPYPT